MPLSDALQPPLEPAERDIVKNAGGWTDVSLSYGLKPWNDDDNEEAHEIVKGLAQHSLQEDSDEAPMAPQELEVPSRASDEVPETPLTAGTEGEILLGHQVADAIEDGARTPEPDDDESPIDATIPDEDDEAAYDLSDDDDERDEDEEDDDNYY